MKHLPILLLALGLVVSTPSSAQDGADILEAAGLYAPSVWDLELGAHATEMPTNEFIDFACGTGGGPPSLPLSGWTEFAQCPAEATGFHEVYFQYDDEPEYWAQALRIPTKILLYRYTSAYAIPVIVSALFDDDGFMAGFRMVTDSRVEVELRQKGSDLAGFLMGRYAGAEWVCEDLPRLDGEREFLSDFFKTRCVQHNEAAGLDLVVERHHLRKAGQFAINPADGTPTTGQFESLSSLEVFLFEGIPDRAARLAAPADQEPAERDLAIQRALDCPGCDLAGADFKRADLRGANLAGADLTGANFHGAILAGADLSGAILVRANLNRADMKRADLREADLSKAMMFEARLDGADLSGARLQGAFGGKIQMIGATVTNANLSPYGSARGAVERRQLQRLEHQSGQPQRRSIGAVQSRRRQHDVYVPAPRQLGRGDPYRRRRQRLRPIRRQPSGRRSDRRGFLPWTADQRQLFRGRNYRR